MEINDFWVAIIIVGVMVLLFPTGRRNDPPHPKHLRYREVWEDKRDDYNDRD